MKWLALAAVSFATATAHADPESEAAALYDQGMQQLNAHNVAKACASFAASQAKRPDIATQAALADCNTQLGKVASAWRIWHDLAKSAPDADLRSEAAANAKLLEPRLPRLAIKLVGASPAGLRLTVNGALIGTQPADLAAPVDPGPVVVAASAPGFRGWTQSYVAAEGRPLDVQVPTLAAAPPTVAPPVGVTPPPGEPASGTPSTALPPVTAAPVPTPTAPLGRPVERNRRTQIGLAVTIGGGVAVLAGLGVGLKAKSSWNTALDLCGGVVDACPQDRFGEVQSNLDDARSAATLSTVIVGVGAAALAAGIVLYVTAPKAHAERSPTAWRVTPLVGPQAISVSLGGGF